MSVSTDKIRHAERHLGRARTSLQDAEAALPDGFYQIRACLDALNTLVASQCNELTHSRQDNDQPDSEEQPK